MNFVEEDIYALQRYVKVEQEDNLRGLLDYPKLKPRLMKRVVLILLKRQWSI